MAMKYSFPFLALSLKFCKVWQYVQDLLLCKVFIESRIISFADLYLTLIEHLL